MFCKVIYLANQIGTPKYGGHKIFEAIQIILGQPEGIDGFYIQFRQSFAKETFSYDEHLKS